MVLADLSLADMPVEQAITELVRVEGAVQLQSQADQLAAHLREQQRELDRRESQINARVADFEQEVREARAWLAQRNDELTEREARLEARETALHGREEVAEARSSREAPSNANHLFLASAAAKASTDSGPREVKDATFGDDEPKLKMPPGGAASSDQRQWEAEWEERKQAMARVSEQLDQRRQALEKFRDEISLMHREALELHLVGEEAKAQLRSSLGIEAAEQALEAARERMVRRYRSDATQLIRSREELEWLRSDLAREHAKLERRYEELKGWIQGQRS
jgi:chromosome segregation ATPase